MTLSAVGELCQLRPCSCEHTGEQHSTDTHSLVPNAADGAQPGHRLHSAASCWLSGFHTVGQLGAPHIAAAASTARTVHPKDLPVSSMCTVQSWKQRGSWKVVAWQIAQPWLEGGMLMGSGRKSVLIKTCCPPGGCVTHLGDVGLTWGSHHPPAGCVTTQGSHCSPRGHSTPLGLTSPTTGQLQG